MKVNANRKVRQVAEVYGNGLITGASDFTNDIINFMNVPVHLTVIKSDVNHPVGMLR